MLNKFEKLCTDNLVFKTIRDRRSIRQFENRDIDDITLQVLIQAAHLAPSAWDTQTCRYIIVRNREVRLSIAHAVLDIMTNITNEEATFSEHKKYLGIDSPVQIFVCNDSRRLGDSRKEAEAKVNCYASTQNLLLAAHAIGLGACWQGDPILAKETIKRLLDIPQGIEPVTSIAIGYSMENPDQPPRKQKLDDILFYEKMD